MKDVSSLKSTVKTEDRILDLILQNDTVTTERVGELLGISKRAVLKQIDKLKKTRPAPPNRPGQGWPLGGSMTYNEAETSYYQHWICGGGSFTHWLLAVLRSFQT